MNKKSNKRDFPIKAIESMKAEIDSEIMKKIIDETKQRQLKNDKLKRIDPNLGNLFVG